MIVKSLLIVGCPLIRKDIISTAFKIQATPVLQRLISGCFLVF